MKDSVRDNPAGSHGPAMAQLSSRCARAGAARRRARVAVRTSVSALIVLVLAVLLAAVMFPGTARAAITFEAYSTAGPTTGTSLLISAPAGTTLNDMLIAQISGTGANPTITAPSGWTLRNKSNTTTNAFEAVYWKRAGAGEGSYTWTFSVSGTYAATILGYGGVTMATNPINASNYRASTLSPITWNSVTSTIGNTMLVALATTRSSGAAFTDPTVLGTALTSRVKQTTSGPSFASWDTVLSGIATTGTFTSGATTYNVTHDILLTPQPAPTVTARSPTSGPATGGTSVAITGTGFTGATAVKFGASNAAGYTVNSATSITATSPAGTGAVDITVTSAGGTSATGSTDRFTYVAAPTVTDVSPDIGPTAGGTTVIITGTGFTGATAVKFGATNATGYTVNSATQITATSPAGSTGTVDVRVTTVGGTSATGSADYFTYLAAPTITTVSPDSGSVDGGQIVTIFGTNFDTVADTSVSFGGAAGTVTAVTSTSISVTTPARDNGATVDVAVTTPGGSATASAAYTYVGSLSATSPSVGNFASITLNGTAQTPTATMGTFTVTDSRGTGVGWKVTVQATQFTSGGYTLPRGSVSMPQPSVTKGTPQSTGLPIIMSGPYTIDGISAIQIASAPADGSGEGSYIFTPGLLTLSVPANAYTGTYTSTVTVSVSSGP